MKMSRQDQELMSYCRMEYKNDVDYAFNMHSERLKAQHPSKAKRALTTILSILFSAK
jgi:hypothetical protein